MNSLQPVRRNRWWTSPWRLLLLAAFALSAFALKVLPIPYLWVGIVWAAFFLGAIACLRRPWSPSIVFPLLNASMFAFMVAAAEALLFAHESSPVYADGYGYEDDVLGFVPVKGVRARSSKKEGGKLLYDVTYSIDSSGLREPPPVIGKPSACILFFGDSFTFGEGLQDQETLPYQVGLQSGGRIRTYNFGFHGYGPNQMLSAIEHGVVRDRVECKPDFAIYQAIPDHAARVAGKVPYARHSPRYRLERDGSVRYAGHFDDEETQSRRRMEAQLSKSAIYRWLRNVLRPAVSADDLRLMLGIVRSAKEQLAHGYPGIQFHVILWMNRDEERPAYKELRRGLSEMNIPLHLVEEILPGYRPGASKYVLSAIDRHPSALTNRMLAAYVVNRIATR
jgi:hypothetical protein